MAFDRPKASSTDRGYGIAHRRERAKYVSLIKAGVLVPCVLCGHPITNPRGREPDGLHLDHTPDRSGYRGPSHNACNVRDGARRGRAKQSQKPRRFTL